MTSIMIVFWSLAGIVLYTYFGYAGLLFLMQKWFPYKREDTSADAAAVRRTLPRLHMLIAAYNEGGIIADKIKNSLALNYPGGYKKIWVICDGSTDNTVAVSQSFAEVETFFEPARKGKQAALKRVIGQVESPITVFTDANAILNEEALTRIARHFDDPKVGCVAGEKRILQTEGQPTAQGEGLYWRYESTLKKWDSRLGSAMGAAGELFAIRTELWEDLPADTIVEDFVLSMRIAMRGYRLVYEPDAYAQELASDNFQEEWKRKVRIAAGGAQAVVRFRELLNPFRYGRLSWQYFSHRFLRWTLAPWALPFLLFLNIPLANMAWFYMATLGFQVIFYTLALLEWILQSRGKSWKLATVPFYFCMMNAAIWFGWGRYLKGTQSVIWDKLDR